VHLSHPHGLAVPREEDLPTSKETLGYTLPHKEQTHRGSTFLQNVSALSYNTTRQRSSNKYRMAQRNGKI
jgi:hypothetical protein